VKTRPVEIISIIYTDATFTENKVFFSLRNDKANSIYLMFDIVRFWLIQSHPQLGPASTTSGNKDTYRLGWLIY
jgi:hypothetical protein